MAPTSGSKSKTGETLAEAGKTVSNEPDATLCMDDCLYERRYQKDMIRCANCATWVHVKCIAKHEEYVPGFWSCFQCRRMPAQISELTTGMTDVLSTLKTLTKSLDKLHREQCKMKSELKDKDEKITELIKENAELKSRIGSMTQSNNALHWQGLSPVQPQNPNTLLIGSSIIRDVDENKLLNTKCICIPGGYVSDVKEAVAKFPTTNKMRRIVLPSKHACTVSVMKRYRLPVLTSTVTVPACQYTVPKQYRCSTETGLRAHWACTGTVPQQYSSGIKMVPFLYWWCRFTVVVVQKLYNFWTDFTCYGTDVTKTVPFLY